MKKSILLLAVSIFSFASINAQNNDTIKLSLDFPLLDFPYQNHASLTTGTFLKSFSNPSMNQSLQISTDLYSSLNYGVKSIIKVKNKKLDWALTQLTAGAVDYLFQTMPLGVAWQHEEYHRAVFAKNHISSYNEVYEMKIFAPAIFVSHVADEDLIRLNNTNNADFRRLNSAGNESTIAQLQLMQKNNFFNNSELPNLLHYWVSALGNSGYIKSTSSEAANQGIDDETNAESTDISTRDFTGPDYSAWAYALFNPTTPYENRGPHPSGVGIYRSIRPNQLSAEALTYLSRQGNLSYLNLISPHMFGFNGFKIAENKKGSYYGNFAVRHGLTPFGNDISLDVFLKTPNNKLLFTVHNYNNHQTSFFGAEASIIDKSFKNKDWLFSGTAHLWLQPENQDFYSAVQEFGGALKLKATYNKYKLKPYIELTSKTDGWVQTNVFLEQNRGVSFGLRMDVR